MPAPNIFMELTIDRKEQKENSLNLKRTMQTRHSIEM